MTSMFQKILIALLALSLAAPLAAKEAKPKKKGKEGAEKHEKEDGPIGYNDAQVQLQPFLAPWRSSTGIRYEPLTVRLTLGPEPRERPACFFIPIVHDRMVQFIYKANLTSADFTGERRKVLADKLLKVAIETTGKGYYSAADIIDLEPRSDDPKALQTMSQKSQTLSAQCK